MTVEIIGIDQTTGLCPHCGQKPIMMDLTVAADLSHTRKEHQKQVPIDSCIADIVKALNSNGVKTKACCCGHGKAPGNIILMDGRTLLIER